MCVVVYSLTAVRKSLVVSRLCGCREVWKVAYGHINPDKRWENEASKGGVKGAGFVRVEALPLLELGEFSNNRV